MKKLYLLIILISVSLTSCLPKVYRTLSTEKNSEWLSGKQIVYKTNNNLDISISHEQMTDNYSIYYLQVYNKSGANILVDPGQFSIDYGDYINSVFVVKSMFKCIDPEIKLQLLENDQKIADANANKSAIDAKMALVAPITKPGSSRTGKDSKDSHSDSNTDQKNNSTKDSVVKTEIWQNNNSDKVNKHADEKAERVKAEKEAAEQTRKKLETHQQNVQKLNELAGEKLFWENDVLRITTLHSQKDIRGLIVFPVLKEKNNIIIRLRFGNEVIPINFETVEIDPNN